MQSEKEIEKEGWGPTNGKKWHYFRFPVGHGMTESLCDKIGLYGAKELLEQGNDNSKDNCVECKKRLLKLRENHSEWG
jgi:hypothetical protein